MFFLEQFFEFVEEAVWAVEVLKPTGLPVAVTMCISEMGDGRGISCGDCAVKLAQAGIQDQTGNVCSQIGFLRLQSGTGLIIKICGCTRYHGIAPDQHNHSVNDVDPRWMQFPFVPSPPSFATIIPLPFIVKSRCSGGTSIYLPRCEPY